MTTPKTSTHVENRFVAQPDAPVESRAGLILDCNVIDPDTTVLDGFDHCILGVVERMGIPPLVCYDTLAIIHELQARDEMSEEAAWECFPSTILGTSVAPPPPVFLPPYFPPAKTVPGR